MSFSPLRCLCFTNIGFKDITISIGPSPDDGSNYYFSKDGYSWQPDSIKITPTERAFCKGTAAPSNQVTPNGFSFSTTYSTDEASIEVTGCVLSLLDDGDGYSGTSMPNYCFHRLFDRTFDTQGTFEFCLGDDLLNIDTVSDYGCLQMFAARKIYQIPELFLKAKNLGTFCYSGLFKGCQELTKTPRVLFSKEINTYGYGCFEELFADCPYLEEIYLQFPTWDLADDGDASQCFMNWVNNVSAFGVFHGRTTLPVESGASRIPGGWANDTEMGEIDTSKCLKFVNLDNRKVTINAQRSHASGAPYYFADPNDITDITPYKIGIEKGKSVYCFGTDAPCLPGSEDILTFEIDGKVKLEGSLMSLLDNGKGAQVALGPSQGFQGLFKNQTGVREITKDLLPATSIGYYSYKELFLNTRLTEIPAELLPATTLYDSCYEGMFRYTLVSKVPTGLLPATVVAKEAYKNMFADCGNLVEVESGAIKAQSLGSNSLSGMFSQDESLNKICVEFTNWNEAANSTDYWVSGVNTDKGTFVCPATLPKIYNQHHIPESWQPKPKKKGSLIFAASIKSPISGEVEE